MQKSYWIGNNPRAIKPLKLLTDVFCLQAVAKVFEINEQNQFIDFRLIIRSRKNHIFILLRQQSQEPLTPFSHTSYVYHLTLQIKFLSFFERR